VVDLRQVEDRDAGPDRVKEDLDGIAANDP
jgi:hypothetical protein